MAAFETKIYRRCVFGLMSAFFVCTLCACATTGWNIFPFDSADDAEQNAERVPLQRLEPAEYPVFSDDLNYAGLAELLEKSRAYYQKISAERLIAFGNDSYSAAHLAFSCQKFMEILAERPSNATLNERIRNDFWVYKATGLAQKTTERDKGKVLFTGYYEPFLRGSHTKSERFNVPLHGMPNDLATIDLSPFGFAGKSIRGRWTGKSFEPYYNADAINYENALSGTAESIVYVDCPLDKFFLQVQGSGLVRLENGEILRVGYAGQNGLQYHSVGKYLIETGKVPREEMSMARIRQYFAEHPEDLRDVLAVNPSYVFFRTLKDGPLGALGFALTAGRSLAVDRSCFPDGALAYIECVRPVLETAESVQLLKTSECKRSDSAALPNIEKWRSFSRFMAAQDTGGAIKGSGRADIFWGNDVYAQVAAGHLQHTGDMYFLVLK